MKPDGRTRSASTTISVDANQSSSLALVEHDLQRADPQHQQAQADARRSAALRRGVARCGRCDQVNAAAARPTGTLM